MRVSETEHWHVFVTHPGVVLDWEIVSNQNALDGVEGRVGSPEHASNLS